MIHFRVGAVPHLDEFILVGRFHEVRIDDFFAEVTLSFSFDVVGGVVKFQESDLESR